MTITTHPLSWTPDSGVAESGDYVLTQGAFIVHFINPLSRRDLVNDGEIVLSESDTETPQNFTLFGVQEVTGMKRGAPQFDIVKDNGSNFEYQLPQPNRKPVTLEMSFVVTAREVSKVWKITTDLKAMELWHKYSVGFDLEPLSELFSAYQDLKINFGYGPRAEYDLQAYCRITKLLELRKPSERLDGYGGFDPDRSLRWTLLGARILAINYGKLSITSRQEADANLLMSISVQGMLDWER